MRLRRALPAKAKKKTPEYFAGFDSLGRIISERSGTKRNLVWKAAHVADTWRIRAYERFSLRRCKFGDPQEREREKGVKKKIITYHLSYARIPHSSIFRIIYKRSIDGSGPSLADMHRGIDVRYIEDLINAPNLCNVWCIALAQSLSKCCPGRDRFNDNSCCRSLPCPRFVSGLFCS